jgi:predicted CXXCH cytochrome family protein
MNMYTRYARFFISGATLCFWLLTAAGSPASAEEVDCLKCHAKLKLEKIVHPALEMGCPACHTGIDASKVPHKKTNAIAHGLSADQPELCYGCHDKAAFSKSNVHPAVAMGCTGCHNPHSSPNAKLLKSEAPELCFTCHDKKPFTLKNVHPPVAAGKCLVCHNPHSSDQIALLQKKPVEVCLECHAKVAKEPHVVTGLTTGSHPIGPDKKQRKKNEKGKGWTETITEIKDPARPDKPLYCGSCHEPHSAGVPRLLRYGAKSQMDICVHCHKY